jgi:hypothetical protein
MKFFRKKQPYSKTISIVPPKASASRNGIAIVACVKNEEPYIAEWLTFHRAVGVAHFFLYDDGSDDRTLDVARERLPAEALTVIPWRGRMSDGYSGNILNSQTIAFAHAILNFGSEFERFAFIDVDEFIVPKKGLSIADSLSGSKGFPNISLPWHMFGSSGHIQRPAGPVSRNYTYRAKDPMSRLKNASNFKCIVDPCEVTEVSIHHFSTRDHGELTSNDRGEVFSRRGRKRPEFYSSDFLQLNHYYGKSKEELEQKLARGPASPASRQRYEERVRIAVTNIELETVRDLAIIDLVEKLGVGEHL